MVEFRVFGERKRVPSCSGSRWKRKYHPIVGKDGHIELSEDKPVDLYAEIQSHADSCDLRIIIDRYVNGEVDLIRSPQAGFFDATVMPKTYAEALQMTIDAERDFLSLPVDVRERFGHDYRQYMAQAGSPDWYAKLGVSLTPANDVTKEVASDESEQ